MVKKTLQVGDLDFLWMTNNQRKKTEIVIERDGSLQVRTSPDAAEDEILSFIIANKFKVYQKLALKGKLLNPAPPKEFLNGETIPYLGRNYRITLVSNPDVSLRLHNNRFLLDEKNVANGKEVFIHWLTQQGLKKLKPQITRYSKRLGQEPTGFKIQDLGYRWASCGKDRVLYFHWRAIMLPMDIIEYLVAHETAHLKEPNHTQEFWDLLESLHPGYKVKKKWLAENGSRVDL